MKNLKDFLIESSNDNKYILTDETKVVNVI